VPTVDLPIAMAAPRPWTMVFLLMAICFISHFNRISMAVAGNEKIMDDYGINPREIGWVYSCFLAAYTAFMAFGGYFIDRFGVRIALGTALIGSGLFEALTGYLGLTVTLAGDFLLGLLAIRGLMGIVTTPLHPACAQTVSNWMPPANRTTANGLVTGAAVFGIASCYPLFGRMIDWFHWQRAFVLAGVVTILLGAFWLLFATDSPGGRLRHSTDTLPTAEYRGRFRSLHQVWIGVLSWLKLLGKPGLLFLTLGYAAVGYFQYLFFYWIQYYFDNVVHLGKDQSRWYAAIPVVAMGISMPLGGWISDRVERRYGKATGRKIVPIAGMVLSAFLLLFGVFSLRPAIMVAWFAASFAAMGLAEGPFWLTAIELGGKRGGSAAAIVNIGGNGIGLLAPVFTPLISEAVGWRLGIGVGGLVALLGALCWLPIRLRSEVPVERELQNV
jgi:MFS transporter, ACS family, D-galactonate transporter